MGVNINSQGALGLRAWHVWPQPRRCCPHAPACERLAVENPDAAGEAGDDSRADGGECNPAARAHELGRRQRPERGVLRHQLQRQAAQRAADDVALVTGIEHGRGARAHDGHLVLRGPAMHREARSVAQLLGAQLHAGGLRRREHRVYAGRGGVRQRRERGAAGRAQALGRPAHVQRAQRLSHAGGDPQLRKAAEAVRRSLQQRNHVKIKRRRQHGPLRLRGGCKAGDSLSGGERRRRVLVGRGCDTGGARRGHLRGGRRLVEVRQHRLLLTAHEAARHHAPCSHVGGERRPRLQAHGEPHQAAWLRRRPAGDAGAQRQQCERQPPRRRPLHARTRLARRCRKHALPQTRRLHPAAVGGEAARDEQLLQRSKEEEEALR